MQYCIPVLLETITITSRTVQKCCFNENIVHDFLKGVCLKFNSRVETIYKVK